MSDPCTYVSQTWGVHDQRWVQALTDLGFDVRVLSVEKNELTIQRIRDELSTNHGPVLAGPLTSITHHLVGITQPLIGLSWGFDLLQLSNDGGDVSWLKKVDGLIVDSHTTRDIALTSGLSDDRIYSIPWGIDVQKFTPKGPHMDLGVWKISPSDQVIVSLRAHEPFYRVHDIVDAFALIQDDFPDTHLIIGNHGSLSEQLREQVRSLGIGDRTTFIGMLPESDLPSLLRASSVYVTASEVDGTSVTLLQAMSCGLPVVASATSGNAEWVIPGETGYLFTTGSPQEMAMALSSALTDHDSGDPQGLTAMAQDVVSKKANWDRNYRSLLTIMRTVPHGRYE